MVTLKLSSACRLMSTSSDLCVLSTSTLLILRILCQVRSNTPSPWERPVDGGVRPSRGRIIRSNRPQSR